jgi:hypothetical protein
MMRRLSAIMTSIPAPTLLQKPSRPPTRPDTFRRFSPPTLIFDADDAALSGFKQLAKAGLIRSHMLLERDGIRFGLFGMMGTDSIQFTVNPGAVTFSHPVEAARKTARQLRAEGADVIICMSHSGVREPESGPVTEGEDIDLARSVPESDHRQWHADRTGRLLWRGARRAGDPDGRPRKEGGVLQATHHRRHNSGGCSPCQGHGGL